MSTFNQFKAPDKGDLVAHIHVQDFGVIKIRLFPEITPKTVENFATHSKNGYYNGVTFHRVMQDFMIQGGDPQGNGTGGESIWGDSFEDEFNQDAFPYNGSLCMANRGFNTNGSQFFIVELENADDSFIGQMERASYPAEVIENYKQHGGTPWLYFKHTVFGQVFEGQDIVKRIARVPVSSPMTNKPKDDVIIEKIDIIEL